jgi:MYXO-CTERM domain-containing protein
MKPIPCATLVLLVPLLVAPAARADIPVGYMGKPFDPLVAGGPKLPAGVKGGPYAIPGRLDFINYDMGGDGVAYHAGDHIAKGGAGYRIDGQTATLSWTGQCIPNVAGQACMNVWYDTSATLDGTPFPSATTTDFSIGAVQNGDWFNLTVNVATSGTYSLSSTWASGEGPPGGEGGNGSMGLAVFSNNVQIATWSAIFPNFNMYADFHHWKAYPSFATVTLTAGLQVIKMQSKAKHLQLDYVQFDLVGADGGAPAPDGGAPADGGVTGAGGSGAGGTTGAAGTSGTAGTTAAAGTSGGTAGTGATGAAGTASGTGSAGSGGAGTTGAAGTIGGTATGAAGTGTKAKAGNGGGCSCTLAASGGAGAAASFLAVAAIALGLIGRTRRRRRPPS